MSKGPYIYIILLFQALLVFKNASGQNLQLRFNSNPLNLKYQSTGDSASLIQSVARLKNQYILNGYLECNADSIVWKIGEVTAYMHYGPRYTIKELNIYGDSLNISLKGLSNRYLNTVYDTLKIIKISEDILGTFENNGYPFTSVQPQLSYNGAGISCSLRVDPGMYFRFDTCHIDGDPVIRKSFLEAYTGIKQGQAYNEALFRKAHEKLNQLPFLFSERNPLLVFIHGGRAKPYYYIRKKRSDQVNGIIGLAPGASAGNASGVVLTGEFSLKLNNLFKTAKVLHINWRSFQARSQELKTYFSYPYLLSKPLGIDVGVDLLKFDTLYTVFQRQAGFQYFTSGINGFKVFYKVSNTNLNTVDTASIRNSGQFPAINAIEVRQYGVMAGFNLLDYRFNPRRGMLIEASAGVGSKQILRDNLISEVRFGPGLKNLYDSSELRTTQYSYRVKVDKFIPAGVKSTFRIGVYLTQTIAPRIYFNELDREGGINSLKGFNEQSIFASNFNMLELEYRFITGQNSHFRIFWNGAYYEDKSYGRPNQVFDFPWGFGAGGNLETGAGILTLVYALGKEKSNNFDIRTGKFHFGISSYF